MPDYRKTHSGGNHSDTLSIRNALAAMEINAPHTGKPYTETMLFGISGGIGASYFVFEYKAEDFMTLFIGCRHGQKSGIMDQICERIGVPFKHVQSTSTQKAEKNLITALESGIPAITFIDMRLPYFGNPEEVYYMQHVCVAYDYDNDKKLFTLGDIPKKLVTATADEMTDARASIKSFKNKITLLDKPKKAVPIEESIKAGIKDLCSYMVKPDMTNFGLPAIKKWANLVQDRKTAKGWTKIFDKSKNLVMALHNTYYYIEKYGFTGGYRGMYADFLDEAGEATGNKKLIKLAPGYRELASMWRKAASSALPDSVPLFKEMKECIDEKFRLFVTQEKGAREKMLKLHGRINELKKEAAGHFPLKENEISDLFDDLHKQITVIYEKESKAIEELTHAIK